MDEKCPTGRGRNGWSSFGRFINLNGAFGRSPKFHFGSIFGWGHLHCTWDVLDSWKSVSLQLSSISNYPKPCLPVIGYRSEQNCSELMGNTVYPLASNFIVLVSYIQFVKIQRAPHHPQESSPCWWEYLRCNINIQFYQEIEITFILLSSHFNLVWKMVQ